MDDVSTSQDRRVWLSLGSNLGDRWAYLGGAVRALQDDSAFQDIRLSSVFETEPMGGPEQPRYLNAVVQFHTDISATDILHWAQTQEARAQRARVEHWGPRTLDVDIIAIEGECFSSAELVVPHPRAHQRAFVVVPLSELVDPTTILSARIDMDESGVVAIAGRDYPVNSPFREGAA